MPHPLRDITGQVFGRLEVLIKSRRKSGGNTMYRVRCLDCGAEKNVQRGSLFRLKGTGCRCDRRKLTGKSLIGKKIDRITVVAFAKSDEHQKLRWVCRCECGNQMVHTTSYIRQREKTNVFACNSCLRRVKDEQLGTNLLLHEYKHNARLRAIPWKLSDKEVLRIAAQNCHYCGSKPRLTTRLRQDKYGSRIKFYTNGIDRIDSSRGYVEGNCIPCCRYCNTLKSDLSYDDFLVQIEKIARIAISRKSLG